MFGGEAAGILCPMQPFEAYPESAPHPPGASTAQKALAVVAIMLGSLGVLGGCCGAMGNMASSSMRVNHFVSDWLEPS